MQPSVLKQGKTPKELGLEVNAISIDLTERCNLHCEYCFASLVPGDTSCKTGKSNNDLTLEMGKKIIDWFLSEEVSGIANRNGNATKSNQPFKIDFWGGEPILQFDLLTELVDYGNIQANKVKKNIIWGGTSNITLITPDRISWLVGKNVHFLLSVDGIGERNKHRIFPDGTNSWDVIYKNLQHIKTEYRDTEKMMPSLRLTVSPGTIRGMAEDIKAFYEMGFTNIFFSENYDMPWTEEDYEIYYHELREISDFRIHLMVTGKDFLLSKFIDDSAKYILRSSIEGKKVLMNFSGRSCGAGDSFFGISVEGAIYPCHRFNKHNTLDKEWHEKEQCVGSIFEGITNTEFLNQLSTSVVPQVDFDKKSILPHCNNCIVDFSCLGGCYAVKYDYNKTLSNTVDDRICRIKKLFYRIGWEEIQNAIQKMVFGKYMSVLGITNLKLFTIPMGVEGQAIPECTCNVAEYISRSEFLENLIYNNQYSEENKLLNDKIHLLVGVKKVIDTELTLLTSSTPSRGCVCFNGQYNKTNLLSSVTSIFPDSFVLELLNSLIQYWGTRNNEQLPDEYDSE